LDLDGYLNSNRTKPRLLEGLRILALVRYSTYDTLHTVKKSALRLHIFSKPSLAQLEALGIIEKDPYRLTAKGFNLLKKYGSIEFDDYQERMRGTGNAHDLQIGAYILQELNERPDFYTAFYPKFEHVRPDACLIYRKDSAYKIEFLEVERTDKGPDYIPNKERNYERLAKDYETYSVWWQETYKKLGLPFCTAEQFCFWIRYEK
jgi:hypothetical protein